MSDLVIALAQINPTVGALAANTARIQAAALKAVSHGAQVVVFPELAISGYPPEDLILKSHFIEDCGTQLNLLAKSLPPEAVCIVGAPTPGGTRARNSAIIYSGGRQVGIYDKQLLPNYGVFDEKRVFEPGDQSLVLQVGSARIAVHICEDSWFQDDRLKSLRNADLDALINLSASPYHHHKLAEREEILYRTSGAVDATLFYCNMVGGQDELVFDGASLVVSPQGDTIDRAPQFEESILYARLPIQDHSPAIQQNKESAEELIVLDLPKVPETASPPPEPQLAPALEANESVYRALTLGLRDYVHKTGFKDIVIAISGGIDSALAATIAVDAIGPDRVRGVTMPSQYNSEETISDAIELAHNLGIRIDTLPIKGLFDQFHDSLSPLWPGHDPDITEENLQARIRGNIIMALSNKFGALVVATGNKSELATGYCTLYGDMCGGFAVIKDVPKMLVFELCRWKNTSTGREVIPLTTIDRPPSAELRPDQKDSDSLPDYAVLDGIIERYVELDQGLNAIVEAGYPAELVARVIRLIDLNEYKRRQAPPGVKITPKAFGKDRRMPITNRYRETVS